MTVAVYALTNAGLSQDLDRTPLEYAGPDTLHNVLSRFSLENDTFDSVSMQDLREQQSGRTASDNRYLRSHHRAAISLDREMLLSRRENTARALCSKIC